jgi:hypothetical protein
MRSRKENVRCGSARSQSRPAMGKRRKGLDSSINVEATKTHLGHFAARLFLILIRSQRMLVPPRRDWPDKGRPPATAPPLSNCRDGDILTYLSLLAPGRA